MELTVASTPTPLSREVALEAAIETFVQGLVGLPRVLRIYEATNDRVRGQLVRVATQLEDVLGKLEGGLGLDVTTNGELTHAGVPLTGEAAKLFGRSLHERGIHSVYFGGKLTTAEIGELGTVLSATPREISERRMQGQPLLSFPSDNLTIEVGGVDAALRDLNRVLAQPEISERLENIRGLLGPAAGTRGDSLTKLLQRYLRENGMRSIDTAALTSAVRRFLSKLRALLEKGLHANEKRVRHSIWDILKQSFEKTVQLAPTAKDQSEDKTKSDVKMAYERLDGEHVLAGKLAAQTVRNQFAAYDSENMGFLICCELRIAARTPRDREDASETMRKTVASDVYGTDAILNGIRELARISAGGTVDGTLADELVTHAKSRAAVVRIVTGLGNLDWHSARLLIERIAARQDSLHVIVDILAGEPGDALKREAVRALAGMARRRPESWFKWGVNHSAELARPNVLRALLDYCQEILVPVVRGILTRGSTEEQQRLIEILVEDGQLRALRLLVLGVPYGDQPRDLALLEAFGRFKHPLAVAVLREAVHRSNTNQVGVAEGVHALSALGRSGSREAREFLQSVTSKRSFGIPVYQGKLRKAARVALAS